MNSVPRCCLSCKFFRLTDQQGGLCRVDNSRRPDYPREKKEYLCEKWSNCGQHYYIRLGWLKGQRKLSEKE